MKQQTRNKYRGMFIKLLKDQAETLDVAPNDHNLATIAHDLHGFEYATALDWVRGRVKAPTKSHAERIYQVLKAEDRLICNKPLEPADPNMGSLKQIVSEQDYLLEHYRNLYGASVNEAEVLLAAYRAGRIK